MKKTTTALFLLFVLSVSVLAEEGQYPTGGKTCPPGQTCLVEGDPVPADESAENPIIDNVLDFLKSIFG